MQDDVGTFASGAATPLNHPPSTGSSQVMRFATIESTQVEARRMVESGRMVGPTVLVAERQTGGVGRLGRAWSSPVGGLWMTLVVPLSRIPDAFGLRVGVACCRAVRAVVGGAGGEPATVMLKWPNDVLMRTTERGETVAADPAVSARKVLGVLTEVARGHALIGVGLNANVQVEDLPLELRGRSTSLRHELGRTIELEEARERIVRELLAATDAATPLRPWVEAARSFLLKDCSADMTLSRSQQGIVQGIADNGNAVVCGADGRLVEIVGMVVEAG